MHCALIGQCRTPLFNLMLIAIVGTTAFVPNSIEFSLSSGEDNGIADPDYLKTLEAFSNWLASQPDILHVSTFTHVMKRLNKSMHTDDPDFYRLPEDRQLAAQYLLLYELSLPFGLDLTNQVTMSKDAPPA